MEQSLKESLEQMNEAKMSSMTEEEFDAWMLKFAGVELSWEEGQKLDKLIGEFYGRN